MRLVFLDTETTGIEDGRLVELAFDGPNEDESWRGYFKPPVPISIEAMSVNHITEKMVEGAPVFATSNIPEIVRDALDGNVMVAHNAPFDIGVLKREGVEVGEYIDTKRVAMRLLPDLPSHSLQYLRYALGLEVEAEAHSAAGDVKVLKAVFGLLLGEAKRQMIVDDDGEAIDWMRKQTHEPVILNLVPLGKHKGKAFEQVAKEDRGYLEWMMRQDFGEDIKATVGHWLNDGKH
jgi:exodeoxyribonuclease X